TTLEDAKSCTLKLENFTLYEIKEGYTHYFIDFERKYVFTTVTKNDEVRRCSPKEYYTMTAPVQRDNILDREKRRSAIKKIETNIPIVKMANIEKCNSRIKCILLNFKFFFSLSTVHKGERVRFAYIKDTNKLKKKW
ncbi:hypothetical protein K501DRAFT_192253, partial [Backusella circina FSU 941]